MTRMVARAGPVRSSEKAGRGPANRPPERQKRRPRRRQGASRRPLQPAV